MCARDASAAPSTLIVVECKLWRRAVPQGEVHIFRTTLADVGASIGFVVSSRGFQAGARRAATHTNVRLVTWEEFQSILIERWYQNHMLNVIRRESLRLFGYTVNQGAFFMELFWHSQDVHEEAQELSDKYYSLADFTRTLLWFKGAIANDEPRMLQLPLRCLLAERHHRWPSLPDDVLDAPALRPLLAALVNHFRQAIAEFNHVLGYRTDESLYRFP
ncbi:restriction endonuclease [Amycolatopsis thermoflava]|uniref:restriction endonuclease n=1 Tax=Amycolatopsis thermoflava TaxID=84480 RepID=UPI003977ABE2